MVCAVHIAYDVGGAGDGLVEELGGHGLVFGFPALLALALRKRFAASLSVP